MTLEVKPVSIIYATIAAFVLMMGGGLLFMKIGLFNASPLDWLLKALLGLIGASIWVYIYKRST